MHCHHLVINELTALPSQASRHGPSLTVQYAAILEALKVLPWLWYMRKVPGSYLKSPQLEVLLEPATVLL